MRSSSPKPTRCSPYSHRTGKFLNPLYIAVDKLPGYEAAWVDQDALATLRETEFVDYEGVTRLKLPVLRKVWQASADAAEAERPGARHLSGSDRTQGRSFGCMHSSKRYRWRWSSVVIVADGPTGPQNSGLRIVKR
jgi:hypothetical protein